MEKFAPIENLVPIRNTFTIFSKTNCPNCKCVKLLLEDYEFKFIEINCDKFIQDNRDAFIEHMRNLTNKENIIFPIVFYNKEYIGGFAQTEQFVRKMIDF